MRSTMIAECTDRNCTHCSATERGSRHKVARTTVQRESAPLHAMRSAAENSRRNRSQADSRSDEVRAGYDIESERLESSLYVFALCLISVSLVVGIGIGRSIGMWK